MNDKRDIPRIDIIGQNGNDGEHYSVATPYIEQQTARKMVEEVARMLEKWAKQEEALVNPASASKLTAQANKLRDAMTLMVGCG